MEQTVALDVKTLIIIGLTLVFAFLIWKPLTPNPTPTLVPASQVQQNKEACISYDGDYTNDVC